MINSERRCTAERCVLEQAVGRHPNLVLADAAGEVVVEELPDGRRFNMTYYKTDLALAGLERALRDGVPGAHLIDLTGRWA